MKQQLSDLVYRMSAVCALASCVLVAEPAASRDASSATTDLYVSPTGSGGACSSDLPCSLTDAQSKVRALNTAMTGDIVVSLSTGTYQLASTFQLTEADSGHNGFKVIYQNAPGASPLISGGAPITGWTRHDARLDIWKASVSPSARFRQIYVNGTRGILGRSPNLIDYNTRGPFYSNTAGISASAPYTFAADASHLANWANLSEVELVLIDHWKQKNLRIASISGGTISFQSPENTDPVLGHLNQQGTPHYFENAYEFLDAGGEWYLDTSAGVLYYKPRPGERMSEATVIAPHLDNLVTVFGATTRNVAHDLRITGLAFQDSNMTLPNEIGYVNYQAGSRFGSKEWPLGTPYPGAIELRNARNITIDNNSISHTGFHGIVVLDETTDCVFDHNRIFDTSSGGIYLALRNSNSSGNRITYNSVSDGGIEYTDTVGILLEFAPNSVVNHNEVSRYRHTGISAGFDWSDRGTAAKNIEIGYNYIHDVMLLHDDGGGIYTLGRVPGMNIHDNYIKTVLGSRYNGGWTIAAIYLDNGSFGKTIRSNVIDGAAAAFFAANGPVGDNTFRNNFYNSPVGSIDGANAVEGNVPVQASDWPAAALAIMGNAGTQALPASPKVPPAITEN